MTAIELKNELHQMIDGLHDEDILECVHKVVRTFQMKDSVKEYIDPIHELNESQLAELEEAIEQSKNGKMTSHEDFKKEFQVEKSMKEDAVLTHFASEKVLSKDWSSTIEDEVWQDL